MVAPARRLLPSTEALAWQVLSEVPDPEIPVLSVVDLGVVRSLEVADNRVAVELTPTYVGCPATSVIRESVTAALRRAGFDEVAVTLALSPAWSSDWISAAGREKLLTYGIVPPSRLVESVHPLRGTHLIAACPRCQSTDTECLSEFGSTPCKALHRCRNCWEPFERFKCI